MLEGRTYGDRPYRLCAEKVREFVVATGDDAGRWTGQAPPGFAACLLFVVAPDLLADPLVEGAVIHGDQTFRWHRALSMESDVSVNGTVTRVRRRGDVAFVGFSLEVADDSGPMVEGKSTFLVGDATVTTPPDELDEPGPFERSATLPPGGRLPSPRSASRLDLIRYSAATRDWNPIHWDHAMAVQAGLGGVVVHGLLQSAWLTQVAAASRPDTGHPIQTARFRYRSPLRPAAAAVVDGRFDDGIAELELVAGDQVTVSGRFEMAP